MNEIMQIFSLHKFMQICICVGQFFPGTFKFSLPLKYEGIFYADGLCIIDLECCCWRVGSDLL